VNERVGAAFIHDQVILQPWEGNKVAVTDTPRRLKAILEEKLKFPIQHIRLG